MKNQGKRTTEQKVVTTYCDEKDILLDLKCILKDYYTATFTEKEDGLSLKFTDGTKFIITVKREK